MNLTDLEKQIITSIRQMIKDGNELVYIGDLGENTKQLRGAMASLVKKGLIDVNNEDGGLISLFESEASQIFPVS